MTHAEKVARARELRASGWIYREIAAELGVARSTVGEWFMPPDNERKRRWERENDRRPCPRCGALMSAGSHRAGVQLCWSCYADERRAVRDEVVRLRCDDGLTNREIAARLEISLPAVQDHLSRARKRGLDVPRDPYMTDRRATRREVAS